MQVLDVNVNVIRDIPIVNSAAESARVAQPLNWRVLAFCTHYAPGIMLAAGTTWLNKRGARSVLPPPPCLMHSPSRVYPSLAALSFNYTKPRARHFLIHSSSIYRDAFALADETAGWCPSAGKSGPFVAAVVYDLRSIRP